ncbi:hypothetical protein Ana3638_20875 [Anaerocolumna sedimenticola]|uniref:Uncharacterized protein n=1 Tax=Anaerocolumna sedimenticola TaxID=2696063 RepID=A0A6P1TNV1_9FIRM|nr:hypothetical protein [Anaerocolumna sedimenticola]QHQ62930.1 hypothetical protein Ana3638_20875 [Anaerocolumna sedimenticola]
MDVLWLLKLILTAQQVLKSTRFIVTGTKEIKEYIDGKYTGKITGIAYSGVAPDNNYIPLTIKILSPTSVISKEDLEKGPVNVNVKGFTATLYKDKQNNVQLSCKAETLEVGIK